MKVADKGLYLIITNMPVFLNNHTIPPSVAFVAETDGFSYWSALDGNVVNGDIYVVSEIKEAGWVR